MVTAIGRRRVRSAIARDVSVLLALALICRLAFLIAMPRVLDTADAVHYLRAAEHIASGSWLAVDPKIPILYPAMVALFHLSTLDFEWAGRMVSLLFSVSLVAPVYLLSLDMHGARTARIAALTVAIWPWLMDYGCRVSTESLAVFLWFLAVWLFARGLREDHPGWMAGAALSFIALHETRPEGTFILLAAIPASLVLGFRVAGIRWGRLALFGFLSGGALLGHALCMKAVLGHATVNHRLSFIGEQPEGSTVLVEFAKTFIAMTADVPAVMLGPVLWMFAGAGLFMAGDTQRDHRLEIYVLFFALIQWCVAIPVLSPAPRYMMATLIAATLWSSRGIVMVGQWAGERSAHRALRAAPAGVLVALMGFQTLVTVGADRVPGRVPREPREYKAVGEWMRSNVEAGLIMTRKPQVAYYAGMESRGPRLDDSLEDILVMARAGSFRYLVVDERYSARMAPALGPLLDPANAPSELRLLRADLSPYPQARVVVYEFVFD
ncbi:MAG: glycosyltransferase family 39 protein [Candidatus Hydrogenedentes bacterium]|nr:glycosyltransferase family 39 protein [Candidatus Hydrogenedentota bacterium]